MKLDQLPDEAVMHARCHDLQNNEKLKMLWR
jgi:hypothetical protein